MTMPIKNIIAAIVFAVIGLGYGVLTSALPERAGIGIPGPAFFPQLIAGFVVCLSFALLYKGVTGLKAHDHHFRNTTLPIKAICLLVWFAVFIFLLPYLGFLITAVPFFAGLMVMCHSCQWLKIAICAMVIPIFLFFLFRDGFQILLPYGTWM